MLQMIRTSKKDIKNGIEAGSYIEITNGNIANYCRHQCRCTACSFGTYGRTGIVFVSYDGQIYATASRAMIVQYF